jgi:hypothetical protein
MRIFLLIATTALLSGCTGYRNHFDCPPGMGVGCKSVTEIEGAIIEQEDQGDLFGLTVECADCATPKEKTRRIWVKGSEYIYFEG